MAEQTDQKNRLQNASSPYLQEAAEQPVDWYEWGDEAFEAAQEADKPMLLDIGAVWCHWCHVIDRESYSDDDIAEIINEKYIPVKVDRDERPDIDARYQQAVQAISGQGGWPLTAFLTPQGEVFYGGTYFPPESRQGRPGMKDILPQVAEFYQENPSGVQENAEKIRDYLEKSDDQIQSGEVTTSIIDSIVNSLLNSFDKEHGGFGGSPKFPSTPALELASYLWTQDKGDELREVMTKTLTSMAKGGFHDQLGGAFHRYSVDAHWHVPHFEVMSYVNSELLRLYLWNYQLHGDEYFRDVAEHLVEYVMRKGADTVNGGFYASQDADHSMEDDGDFWTWSVDEVNAVLDTQASRIICEYFDIRPEGDMHENPEKNVLHISKRPAQIATEMDLDRAKVEAIIEESCRKMLESREQRPEPFIDSSLYVNWNGMMAEAFFEAGRLLERERLTELALKTVQRIWEEAWNEEKGFRHKLGQESGDDSGPFLGDHVFFARASLSAFELTGDRTHLHRAEQVMDTAYEMLWNNEQGGFYDTPPAENGHGFLKIPSQPIQDSPTPGENAVAALVLQRLYLLSENEKYRDLAEKTLERFAGTVGQYGTFSSTFGLAVAQILKEPLHILVIDDGKSDLWNAALKARYPLEIIQRYSRDDEIESMPKVAQSVIENMTLDNVPVALICTANSCTQPIYDINALRERLAELRA
ncbi:MAG: DUF255 domain-containing protein [Candidatus Marinimicrobia bacterium]|nr:DUF255 domain-containing protein [Candidatus Neomarinimicrobiota bacterium]